MLTTRYYSVEMEIDTSKGTFDSYKPTDESQRIAKEGLEGLCNHIIEKKGTFGEPAIIGIEGNPGLGKSHLLNSFKIKLKGANIDFTYNYDKYFLQNHVFMEKDIIVLDDLFQNVSKLTDLDSTANKVAITYIEEMIYDIYEHNKILIVSSNLNIKKLLEKISQNDNIGRLKDRITELLSHTMPIKLEGTSYRIIKAKEESQISKIFDSVKAKVPN